MLLNRIHRNGDNSVRNTAQSQRHLQAAAACTVERLESRQLFSVTGFSLVEQQSFPGGVTTVTNQPNIFHDTLQKTWLQIVSGQIKINGQTLGQQITAGIQKAENAQGLSAYNISNGFDGMPTYNGTLKQTSSGSVLELTFDAHSNQTTFTSTTNSILGSWADPTFHVTYDLDLTIDLSLPSNLASGKVTATAKATTSNVTVSTANVFVGIADVFGSNIPQQIAEGINGQQQNLSSIVPTGLLNTALQIEAAQGYTHLISSLNSSGNLVLTAMDPTLTVNGSRNDNITISSGSKGSVVVTAGGKSQTFNAGLLKSIVVNDNGSGKNAVNIPSLSSGISVKVNDNGNATDSVVVGTGSLSNVAGTVSVNNTFSDTALTIDDQNDSAASVLTVTSKAVEFNGRSVVTYATTKPGQTSLTVEGGRKDNVNIDSSSTPLSVEDLGGTVTVGDGLLSALGGPVLVSNLGKVTIDDYNDKVSRNVELSTVSSGIFPSSTVAFSGLPAIQLGFVTGVTISDGTGDNSYNAESSPSKDFFSISGHFGDTLSGPAAAQVELSLFGRPIAPIPVPFKL